MKKTNRTKGDKTRRVNLTMPTTLFDAAQERMKQLHFNEFSDFVKHCLRKEVTRQEEAQSGKNPINGDPP
jgi:hypothetical protein